MFNKINDGRVDNIRLINPKITEAKEAATLAHDAVKSFFYNNYIENAQITISDNNPSARGVSGVAFNVLTHCESNNLVIVNATLNDTRQRPYLKLSCVAGRLDSSFLIETQVSGCHLVSKNKYASSGLLSGEIISQEVVSTIDGFKLVNSSICSKDPFRSGFVAGNVHNEREGVALTVKRGSMFNNTIINDAHWFSFLSPTSRDQILYQDILLFNNQINNSNHNNATTCVALGALHIGNEYIDKVTYKNVAAINNHINTDKPDHIKDIHITTTVGKVYSSLKCKEELPQEHDQFTVCGTLLNGQEQNRQRLNR